jgi:Holliday junction resolvase
LSKYNKQKGAQGEREFAALLVKHGYVARRHGKQFGAGDTREHADVDHNVPGVHFEVKRTKEKLDIPAAFRQARTEKPDKLPIVAWRGNRQPWRVIMDADDFFALLQSEYEKGWDEGVLDA